MTNPPCKGCTKRHPGCHDKCEGYHEWKENREAEKEYLKKMTQPIEADLIRYNSAMRMRRRKGMDK